MDGVTILAFETLVVVFVAGVVLALCAVRLTREQIQGRGATVVLAFFIPALYVAYLLAAGQFRNEYHRARSNAYVSDGFNNLKLGDGYTLWFFEETPWKASIGGGSANAQITNIQRLSIDGTKIAGQTGKTDMEDGPIDYFFCLNLETGALLKFATQADLSSATNSLNPLRKPEDLYNAEINKEHSGFFWPLVCVVPVGLAVGLFSAGLRRRKTSAFPVAEASSLSE